MTRNACHVAKQLAITIAVASAATLVAPVMFAGIGLVAGVQLQRAIVRSSFAFVRGAR